MTQKTQFLDHTGGQLRARLNAQSILLASAGNLIPQYLLEGHVDANNLRNVSEFYNGELPIVKPFTSNLSNENCTGQPCNAKQEREYRKR